MNICSGILSLNFDYSSGADAVTNQPEGNGSGQNGSGDEVIARPNEPLIDLSGTHDWNESLLDCCDDIGSCKLIILLIIMLITRDLIKCKVFLI